MDFEWVVKKALEQAQLDPLTSQAPPEDDEAAGLLRSLELSDRGPLAVARAAAGRLLGKGATSPSTRSNHSLRRHWQRLGTRVQ